MDKTIPKHYMEQFCLVWFAHSVILARDINKVIEDDLLAWSFEAIPSPRKKVMDYPNKFPHPRMFRWLAAKSNIKIKEADLFNPPDDAADPGASSGGVVGAGGRQADTATTRDDEHVHA
ncbi:hypothetical protein FXO38_09081 [Capsicum annuum]|nr:hypothetical protein FXO38_09081 [Capsicum annuum]